MNGLSSQQRKLLYLGLMVALLIPIIRLGRPSAPENEDKDKGDAGGYLAQLRKTHELGEATLGNVDPASATMNLVLLGFRGPAATLLAMDLEKYKDRKDWVRLESTTESIIKLQPHFEKVWVYNGWNMSYNVSAEWDDVRDRYHWVKRGLKFYRRGTVQNAKFPELFWYTGNTYGKKIGRADEWRQFRRFFLQDPDPVWSVNGKPGPDRELNENGIDNYLVAKIWFANANRVDEEASKLGKRQHIMAPILFRSYPARSQLDYAAALQREGNFDEITRIAWEEGYNDWTNIYGKSRFEIADNVEVQLEWTPDEIAAEIPDKKKQMILRGWVDRMQSMTNYRYWRARAQAEKEQNTLEGHRELYLAGKAFVEGDSVQAEELAFSGMGKFEKMLDDYRDLAEDEMTLEEGLLGQLTWRAALELNGKEIPKEYPLKKIWLGMQDRLPQVQEEFERRNSPDY